MKQVDQREAAGIALQMVKTVAENKQRLSDIDGLIGDGDHGVNMNKGFQLFRERIEGKDITFAEALLALGDVLLMEIGGSMGPLYGMFFSAMGTAAQDFDTIGAELFEQMLSGGVQAVQELGGAKPGDKTLIDVLVPALNAYQGALKEGQTFETCLEAMKTAADEGCRSTLGMVAKIGRASRLGERSRGVPDAGATSCDLLLETIADGFLSILGKGA
ncbi:MAG: dihydroxyacetone kinase subunit L [Clostridiales bacterium]|nr:dihydroxyacetone kinase subunit L [Clostridiales bacterium]